MSLTNDWVMQQIEMMTRFVSQVIFNKTGQKETISYTVENTEPLTDIDRLYLTLDQLIRERKICEAEDMLFDNLVFEDKYIELASDFYGKLNNLSDEELSNADFSREEIHDGYLDILTRLGVPVEQFRVWDSPNG